MFGLLVAGSLSASIVSAVSWNSRNSPTIFSNSYEYNLDKLPAAGGRDVPGWSETYWPSQKSGIANRWGAADSQDFKYHLYSKDELKNLSSAQMKVLSPAEKYDIFVGRYDYPMVYEEWNRTKPTDADWEGLCHGWSPAALMYTQPGPVTLKNPDGIQVPFGASDIKALLTYYTGQYDSAASFKMIGMRCDQDFDKNPLSAAYPECKDLDAGAFHVLIGNELGLLKTGFVADIDRSYQVWNQPINSFKSIIEKQNGPRINATQGTNTSAAVQTTIFYSDETDPQWIPIKANIATLDISYVLDLDSQGNIIGGDYTNYDRFDFAWSKSATPFFGYFKGLQEVYSKGVEAVNGTVPSHMLNFISVPSDYLLAETHANIIESTGSISLRDYPNNAHYSWTIGSSDNNDANSNLEITFYNVDTVRSFDQISIYEGSQGNGALVAVLDGQISYQTVTVKGASALIVFKSGQSAGNQDQGRGFEAKYTIQSSQ